MNKPAEIEVVETEPTSTTKAKAAKQKKTSQETLRNAPNEPTPSAMPIETTSNTTPVQATSDTAGESGGMPKPRRVVKLTAEAGPALVTQIQRLEGAARDKRIREVNALNSFELDRENNIAVTKEMALRLREGESLTDLAAELGISMPEAPLGLGLFSRTGADKSSIPSDSSSPVPTSSTRLAPGEENANTPDSVSRASTPPSSELGEHEVIPVTVDLSRDGWPAWLEDHHKRFSTVSVPPSVEVAWKELLCFWPMLERAMGFTSPVSRA